MAHTTLPDFFRDRRAQRLAPAWASLCDDPPLDMVLRITPPRPPPSGTVVPRHHFPAILSTTFPALGHNLVAFARNEGCMPTVLGSLKGNHDWGIGGFTPRYDQSAPPRTFPANTRRDALTFLGIVQQQWEPVMQALAIHFPQLQHNTLEHLMLLSDEYIVTLVQAQYQQLALAAQLLQALRHESIALGSHSFAADQALQRPRRLLLAHIRIDPPSTLGLDAEALQRGIVPVAQLFARYIRARFLTRDHDPFATVVHDDDNSRALTQLQAFAALALPSSVCLLPAPTHQAYMALVREVMVCGFALGLNTVSLHTPRDPRDASMAAAQWFAFARIYGHSSLPVINMHPSSGLGSALSGLRYRLLEELQVHPLRETEVPAALTTGGLAGGADLRRACASPGSPDTLARVMHIWHTILLAPIPPEQDVFRQFVAFTLAPLPSAYPPLPPALLARYRSLVWVVGIIIRSLTAARIEVLPTEPIPQSMSLAAFILAYARTAANITSMAPTSPLAIVLNALVAAGLELRTALPADLPTEHLHTIQDRNSVVHTMLNDSDASASARYRTLVATCGGVWLPPPPILPPMAPAPGQRFLLPEGGANHPTRWRPHLGPAPAPPNPRPRNAGLAAASAASAPDHGCRLAVLAALQAAAVDIAPACHALCAESEDYALPPSVAPEDIQAWASQRSAALVSADLAEIPRWPLDASLWVGGGHPCTPTHALPAHGSIGCAIAPPPGYEPPASARLACIIAAAAAYPALGIPPGLADAVSLGAAHQAAHALHVAHCSFVRGPAGIPILFHRGVLLAFPPGLPPPTASGMAWEHAVYVHLATLGDPFAATQPPGFVHQVKGPSSPAPADPPPTPAIIPPEPFSHAPVPSGAGIAASHEAAPSAGPLAALVRAIDVDDFPLADQGALIRLTRATPALVALAFTSNGLSLKILAGEPSLFSLQSGACVASVPPVARHELAHAQAVATAQLRTLPKPAPQLYFDPDDVSLVPPPRLKKKVALLSPAACASAKPTNHARRSPSPPPPRSPSPPQPDDGSDSGAPPLEAVRRPTPPPTDLPAGHDDDEDHSDDDGEDVSASDSVSDIGSSACSDLSSSTGTIPVTSTPPSPPGPRRILHQQPRHWAPPPSPPPPKPTAGIRRIRSRPRVLRAAPTAATGGRARAHAKKEGLAPPPPTTFTVDACLVRRARRTKVVAAKRERKRVTALLSALVTHLRDEGDEILAEVSGREWTPSRWLPWIFPSALADPTEAAPASALSPATAAKLAGMDIPVWRLILERVTCVASISPLGIASLFSPSALLRIDAFVELFAHVQRRPAWLIAVVRRLRILRSDHRPPPPLSSESPASLPDTLDDSSHSGRKLRTAFRSRAATSAAADAAMGHLRIPDPDWSAFDRASINGTLPAFPTPPPRPPGPVHPDRGPPQPSRSQRHPNPRVCHTAAPTTAPIAAPAAAPAASPKPPNPRPTSSAQRLRAALGAKSPGSAAAPTLDGATTATPTPTGVTPATPTPTGATPATPTPTTANPLDAAPALPEAPPPAPPAPSSVPRPARRLDYAAKLRLKSFGIYA
jgi:hypothetical protein